MPDARTMACSYYVDSGRILADDVEAHICAEGGVVVWSEALVLLARPVCRGWDDRIISDPLLQRGERVKFDAWFVFLMCGEIGRLESLEIVASKCPYICFQRGAGGNEKIKWYRSDRFFRLVKKIKNYD